MSPKTMKLLAKPMLFSAALVWGTSFFIMKNTLDVLPVYYLLVFRFLPAALCLVSCRTVTLVCSFGHNKKHKNHSHQSLHDFVQHMQHGQPNI